MVVSEQQKTEVKRLIAQGKKIEAIKYLRQEFNIDLKSAKTLADHIEDDLNPLEYSTTSINIKVIRAKASNLFGKIFLGIGFILLAVTMLLIFLDYDHEKTSIRTIGVVINNPSQPTFEYEFDGNKFYYYSTTSSNPPSYQLGEEVELLVDPSDPSNVIVNTITDRWLGIIVIAFIGSIFTIIGLSVNKLF